MTKRILTCVLLTVILLSVCVTLPACNGDNTSDFLSIEQLNSAGKIIGVYTGTASSEAAIDYFQNAEIKHFATSTDAYFAVSQGKIDAFCYDRSCMMYDINSELDGVRLLDGTIGDKNEICIGISRATDIDGLEQSINEFIAALNDDGTIDEMFDRWVNLGIEELPDIAQPTSPDFTITVGTSGISPPFTYYKDNKLIGFDIELMLRFAAYMNAAVKFEVYDYGGLIAAAAAGTIDCISADLNKTEERAEKIDFSEPVYYATNAVMVKNTDGVDGSAKIYRSADDLAGCRIGAVAGSLYDSIATNAIADCNITYYTSVSEMVIALKQGKIAAFPLNIPTARYLCDSDKSLTTLSLNYTDDPYGFAFEKNEHGAYLRDRMNEYIAKISANGEMAVIDTNAFNTDDTDQPLYDFDALENINGVINAGMCDNFPPMCYTLNGKIAGYEIDIIYGFCKEYGYALNVSNVEFGALLVGLGKFDIVAGSISITEERAQSVYFSDTYYNGGVVAVVLGENYYTQESGGNLWQTFTESFEKNIIREDRWKMILSGFGTTLLISVCSGILGSLIGFGLCMLRRSKHKVLASIELVFIRIIQGTPIVVLLMILYYVIFGNVTVSAILIAIAGFSINFGAYVSEMMRTGIAAVDEGQIEAARALGFGKFETFFRVTFPQAARHFLPVYQGEFISMVKMTSVVGYIAIQDLTKVSDIIRSRTYEAFFPLIVTAIVYFIIAYVFVFLLTRLEVKLDPKRRKRVVKGVE